MDILAGYEAAAVVVALLAAFGSAFVRGLTGFGMAILIVPVLALALSPVDAVLLTNFLSVFIGMSEIRRLLRSAEKSAWIIIALVAVTTPVGLYLLTITSPAIARVVIAFIALSAFVAILLPRRGALDHHPATTGGVGILSGLMTGYAGMPGPPVVPYYVGRDIPRETAKASMLLIFTCASTTGLLSGAAIGVLDWSLLLLAALLFPAVLLGNWLGNKASGRIEDRTWRICVGLVLGTAALAALWKAFG
ncbi:sulfite exporter TauE/SafE family protein [Qipengyuania gelatinilytica]|uniref:Probable membrane transporter protein n=1 Tax=Qipengyuania gelatinilytica TaxID=2867231 RepID=A0ABX8ZYB2_9SPHN|nr:sulfite exporter TauE/SafE family protein [Qipengyuania gelatinilytica]QZD94011.1 sulfite exporter TauE/SafE family protein [Qipengyuania gelatinilytica]